MFDSQGMFSSADPLAARMRPLKIEEIVGQSRILAEGSPLAELARSTNEPSRFAKVSVVLWGPPGTGKTTIAQVIARS